MGIAFKGLIGTYRVHLKGLPGIQSHNSTQVFRHEFRFQVSGAPPIFKTHTTHWTKPEVLPWGLGFRVQGSSFEFRGLGLKCRIKV